MTDMSVNDWLESLAAKQPTPGGGAVAALAAAIAAAQLAMVAIYTTGSKWQDREVRMKELNEELSELRGKALELVDADAKAFAKVGAAYGMPKETDDQKAARTEAIQESLVQAADPPTQTAQLAGRLVEIAVEIAKQGNPSVISDVAVGASLAKASLESAIMNIEINEIAIKDTSVKQKLRQAVDDASDFIQKADNVVEVVRAGMKS